MTPAKMQEPSLMSPAARLHLVRRGYTRRMFSRAGILLSAGAALPFYNEAALAQLSNIGRLPPDAVKLNANENPMGPCPEALEAIARAARLGGGTSTRRPRISSNCWPSRRGSRRTACCRLPARAIRCTV